MAIVAVKRKTKKMGLRNVESKLVSGYDSNIGVSPSYYTFRRKPK